MPFIDSLISDDAGATAIEYGLICALICLAAVAAMSGIGNQVSASLDNAASIMAGS